MRPRLAVPVAALLGACALAVPPAYAQTCAPPSAEHAFEELLDIAVDDSPLEDQAWNIADVQEKAGKFETADTLRMIDDLARSNDLAYHCETRRYVPVSHPDPRDAIENDEEPTYEGPTGLPGDGTTPGGTGSGTSAAPPAGGSGGSGPAPNGSSGPGSATGEAGAPAAGSETFDPETGVRIDGAGGAGGGGRPGANRGQASTGEPGGPGGGSPEDLIGAPADTPDGAGGAVALPGGDDSPTGPLALLAAGCAVALIGTVGGAAVSARRRQRRTL